MTRVFKVKTNEGIYDLEASVRLIGKDLLVAVWGGDKPHIGAVSVAQPRPSLRDPYRISATASVICLPGHKEDALTKSISETLAASLNSPVVVTAGIHWDDINEKGIQLVVKNSKILAEMIFKKLADLKYVNGGAI